MSQAHADCPHCRQDGSEAKHIALKEVRIALAGNPNCGKTTAFNEYTGTHQHVGNYPGVTVDKKEGYVSIDGVEVLMVDLPGTYSLTAYSQEEIVTRAVLAPEKAEEKPMAVVDLVDTSALERNLFLTVQIKNAPAALSQATEEALTRAAGTPPEVVHLEPGRLFLAIHTPVRFAQVPLEADPRNIDNLRRGFQQSLEYVQGILDVLLQDRGLFPAGKGGEA